MIRFSYRIANAQNIFLALGISHVLRGAWPIVAHVLCSSRSWRLLFPPPSLAVPGVRDPQAQAGHVHYLRLFGVSPAFEVGIAEPRQQRDTALAGRGIDH